MSQEIELKLALPSSALAALRRHPLVMASPKTGRAETLDNTYYDTPALTLKGRRIAIRTRRQGRKWLQTVKCAAVSTGGLSVRPEWEDPYGGSFDFSTIDVPEVARLLRKHQADLVAVFTTRFRRETRLYSPREGVRILMMLDTGEISIGDAGTTKTPICELELELVDGSALDLLELACALGRDLPLTPSDISKAERGFRLFLDEPVTPARAEPKVLTADLGVLDAFRELAFSCLRQWQANAAAIADGHDGPEFIHQLRVALRRLRSLLRCFAPALPPDFRDDWNARLRDNADLVGEARDLDVLYDELLAPVVADELADERTDVRGLLAVADEARETARRRSLQQLHASAQGLLILEFTTALHRLQSGGEATNLPRFARAQLDRLRRRARRRFEASSDLVPTHLHALRIAMKHLRYGTEFFAPLLSRKKVARYLDRLAETQTLLGYLHDVDVGRDRLASWSDDVLPLQTAAAFVLGWHGPRYARYRRRVLAEVQPMLWGGKPW